MAGFFDGEITAIKVSGGRKNPDIVVDADDDADVGYDQYDDDDADDVVDDYAVDDDSDGDDDEDYYDDDDGDADDDGDDHAGGDVRTEPMQLQASQPREKLFPCLFHLGGPPARICGSGVMLCYVMLCGVMLG